MGPINWMTISWNFPSGILHAFYSYCSRNWITFWHCLWNCVIRYWNDLIVMSWTFCNYGTFWYWNFDLVLDWLIFWYCCKGGLSAICMIGLLHGNNLGCSGLSSGWDMGNLNVCHFIPALPWPNLGFTWDIPFASGDIIGFIWYISQHQTHQMFANNIHPEYAMMKCHVLFLSIMCQFPAFSADGNNQIPSRLCISNIPLITNWEI